MDVGRPAGAAILHCMEKDIKPRDIMTREAFENAMTITMACGGSTNAVMHLIAMARSVDVPLTIDDFQRTDFGDDGHFNPAGSLKFAGHLAPVVLQTCR